MQTSELKHYRTSFEPNKQSVLEALEAFLTYIYEDNNSRNDNKNT